MGHVGRLTRSALEMRSEVVTYDIAHDNEYPSAAFAACDFLVVCVDTPSTPVGAADLSQVHVAFAQMPRGVPAVLRSTVPPGTTLALTAKYGREVIFWPEYVGETRFVVQTMDQLDKDPFQVFGAYRSPTSSAWIDLVAETYGPLVRLYQLEPTEAEIVKYMENCYFAVKTTFVNEFRNLCDSLGADWHSVREGWLLDPRIERDHSDAFKRSPGYGGRCLPKDVAAVIHRAEEVGGEMPLLTAVQAINNSVTGRTNRSL
jgi:nucleotide sugar dehydrogenase